MYRISYSKKSNNETTTDEFDMINIDYKSIIIKIV
jgi:hypothetical protein